MKYIFISVVENVQASLPNFFEILSKFWDCWGCGDPPTANG